VIRQGGIAKTAIDGIKETINSMVNHSHFLVADWFPGGEMVEEQ
jgi:hypothetical protein